MPITLAGDAARGAVIGQTCAGCHGIPGYYNAQPVYQVPMLGGQNGDYIEVALQAYRRGTRGHETTRARVCRCPIGHADAPRTRELAARSEIMNARVGRQSRPARRPPPRGMPRPAASRRGAGG
jgi:cytochrome c553